MIEEKEVLKDEDYNPNNYIGKQVQATGPINRSCEVLHLPDFKNQKKKIAHI